MMKYKHSEEQRQYIQNKIDKLKRENELGSTLSSQVEANEWVIKQYEQLLNQKVCVDEENKRFDPIMESIKNPSFRFSAYAE